MSGYIFTSLYIDIHSYSAATPTQYHSSIWLIAAQQWSGSPRRLFNAD